MKDSHTKISKFLSYVLRHKPDAIGLELDPEGWASIQELIEKADISITNDVLKDVVDTNEKQRFAISEDGLFIRANQGHSLSVDLGLEAIKPPRYLYHGTANRFVDSIMEKGLVPGSRQYVHLSEDKSTALKVGQRHGKPVILTVCASDMHAKGFEFFKSKNNVWLTLRVGTEFIIGDESR